MLICSHAAYINGALIADVNQFSCAETDVSFDYHNVFNQLLVIGRFSIGLLRCESRFSGAEVHVSFVMELSWSVKMFNCFSVFVHAHA